MPPQEGLANINYLRVCLLEVHLARAAASVSGRVVGYSPPIPLFSHTSQFFNWYKVTCVFSHLEDCVMHLRVSLKPTGAKIFKNQVDGQPSPSSDTSCLKCKGAGRISCPSCAGMGDWICFACKGEKRDNLCPDCRGKRTLFLNTLFSSGGSVTTPASFFCNSCSNGGKLHCLKCGGAARIRCPQCRGKGNVRCSCVLACVRSNW